MLNCSALNITPNNVKVKIFWVLLMNHTMVDTVNTVYKKNTKIIISVFYFAHLILSGMETKFFSAAICSLQEL